mgnify:CR=1 FL=1
MIRTALAGAALAALLLWGCGGGRAANGRALDDIAAGRSGDEVIVEGRVARVLHPEYGPSGEHERFVVTVSDGLHSADVLVAHNVGISPYVPLRRGDDVVVKGVLAIDFGGPVIHWTHHDPRFRHASGFIQVHGHMYE